MAELRLEELRGKIKQGDLAGCYLFYGKERYLLEHYVRELRKAVLGGEDDPFNLRVLEGKNLRMQELADAVDAYPSFAERTLVEVRDYGLFSASEEETKRLISLLGDLPEYCCLLFLFDALEYKPDKRKKQLSQALRDFVNTVEFPLQGQGELTRWVQKHFAARGKEIGAEEAAYLLFLCGSEMDNLANEIGKIAVYAPEKTIRREDIDAVAVPVVEAQTFKLTDALGERNYDLAAELMYKLFQLSTEPIVINAAIGSQLRKLYASLLVKRSGGNAGTLMQLLGSKSEYVPRQYLRLCSAFSEQWYKKMIRLSAEADHRMKSTAEDGEDLLRTLFVTMAAHR